MAVQLMGAPRDTAAEAAPEIVKSGNESRGSLPLACEGAGASTERRSRIIRLLETANDGLPEPRRREVPTTAGFVHADAMVVCGDCLANDRVMRGCETCHGRGVVLERRERDPYADTEKVQPYGLDAARKFGHVPARDAELARLAAQTAAPEQSEADILAAIQPEPWERVRAEMFARYDYAPLVLAMDDLGNRDEEAHYALTELYSRRRLWQDSGDERAKRQPWHLEPSAAMRQAVDRGLAFIDARMPDLIRAPKPEPAAKLAVGQVKRAAGPTAMAERDREIVRAVLSEGASTETVARVWGITSRQVNRIIERQEAA